MKQAALTYLTLVSTLLFPLVAVMWVRSYLFNDTVYRTANGRATMVDSISGELSVWRGPAVPRAGVHYAHVAEDSSHGVTAATVFAMRGSSIQFHLLGFGYGHANWPASRRGDRPGGVVTCWVLPYWFLGTLTGLLPLRLLSQRLTLWSADDGKAPAAEGEDELPDAAAAPPPAPASGPAAAPPTYSVMMSTSELRPPPRRLVATREFIATQKHESS